VRSCNKNFNTGEQRRGNDAKSIIPVCVFFVVGVFGFGFFFVVVGGFFHQKKEEKEDDRGLSHNKGEGLHTAEISEYDTR